MILDLADIGAHLRPDISIRHDGRCALELAVFLRQFMGGGHEHIGIGPFQNLLSADFMCGVQVTMEKQDRHRFDAEVVDLFAERRKVCLVQRRQDFARGKHPLLGLEAQRSFNQRLVFLKIEIVRIRPVDPPDFVYVTKSLGGNQRRFRTGAFQDGVNGNRRPVQEKARRREVRPCLCDTTFDTVHQMVRS